MGLLSGLGKLVGKASGLIPGLSSIKGAISVAGPIVGKVLKRNARKIVAVGAAGGAAAVGYAKTHPVQTAVMGAGAVAGTMALMRGHAATGRRYRRMNPGNTKAMRRAIRRIEGGARIYSKFFSMRSGHIKHAPGVKVKRMSIRRAA